MIVLCQGDLSLWCHYSRHVSLLCTTQFHSTKLWSNIVSSENKPPRSLFRCWVNRLLSLDFSPTCFLFLFFGLFWQSAHTEKRQTHTRTRCKSNSRLMLCPEVRPWFLLHVFRGSLYSKTTTFSVKVFFLIQLHCKDVFLSLALSSHKSRVFLNVTDQSFGFCQKQQSSE